MGFSSSCRVSFSRLALKTHPGSWACSTQSSAVGVHSGRETPLTPCMGPRLAHKQPSPPQPSHACKRLGTSQAGGGRVCQPVREDRVLHQLLQPAPSAVPSVVAGPGEGRCGSRLCWPVRSCLEVCAWASACAPLS